MKQKNQLDFFGHVLGAYASTPDRPMSNSDLYQAVARRAALPVTETERVEAVGKAKAPRNLYQRKVRWYQQTMKAMGLLERVDGQRGVWQLTDRARKDLHPIRRPWKVIAFSTDLGMAIWGAAEDVYSSLDIPITLCFTSPPYPLRQSRQYGNVDSRAIVDFICNALAPIIDRLSLDGSLVIQMSNDIFEPQSPARSTYLERLVLAMEDEFGLSLMDRIIWHNPCKPPGPMQWASRTRQQLNVSWEPVLWFCRDPLKVKSDNRRVLEPHTEAHRALIERGGERREAVYGDGAYRLRHGSYGTPTAGRIPRNLIRQGHRCRWTDLYRERAGALGLPLHGAGMPFALPEFFIRFLTEKGDLVVDPFGGRCMTGRAAESLDRPWICSELMLEYAQGGAELFRDAEGFTSTFDGLFSGPGTQRRANQ